MMDIVQEVTQAARNVAAVGFNEPFLDGDASPNPREVNSRVVPEQEVDTP